MVPVFEPPSPAEIREKIAEAERPGIIGTIARAWLIVGVRRGEISPSMVPSHRRPQAEDEDRRRRDERRRREARRYHAMSKV